MATLTNANLSRDPRPSGSLTPGAPQPSASAPLPDAPASVMSGELMDLAAQFNLRRYRPLGVTDLFDESFDLYRSNFVLFLGAAAMILVPLNIALYELVLPQLNAAAGRTAIGTLDPSQLIDFLGRATSLTITSLIVYTLFFVVLSGASVAIASNRYLGRPAQLGSAYKIALRRAFPLLLCMIAALALTLIGGVLCFVPGVWLFVRYSLLPQVVLLEPSLNPLAALKRAWQVSAGHGWRIFGVVALLIVLSYIILLSLQLPISLLLGLIPVDSFPILGEIARHRSLSDDVASVVSSLLTAPFTFITMTALYYDCRIRDEGYDMAIIASRLGFDSAKPAAAAAAIPYAAAPARPIVPTAKRAQRAQKQKPGKS